MDSAGARFSNADVIEWLKANGSWPFVLGEWAFVTGDMLLRLDTQKWLKDSQATFDPQALVRDFCRDTPLPKALPESSDPVRPGIPAQARQLALAIQSFQGVAAEKQARAKEAEKKAKEAAEKQSGQGTSDILLLVQDEKQELDEHVKRRKMVCIQWNHVHKRQCLIRKVWATCFTLVQVTLNAIVGAAIFSGLPVDADVVKDSRYGQIETAAAVLSILNAIVSAVRAALGLEQASERHLIASKNFQGLAVRLEHEWRLIPTTNQKAYLKDWYRDYDVALGQAPLISDYAWELSKKYMNTKESKGQYTPDSVEMITGWASICGYALFCWWGAIYHMYRHRNEVYKDGQERPSFPQTRSRSRLRNDGHGEHQDGDVNSADSQ